MSNAEFNNLSKSARKKMAAEKVEHAVGNGGPAQFGGQDSCRANRSREADGPIILLGSSLGVVNMPAWLKQ